LRKIPAKLLPGRTSNRISYMSKKMCFMEMQTLKPAEYRPDVCLENIPELKASVEAPNKG
jgi:hypothetical protein